MATWYERAAPLYDPRATWNAATGGDKKVGTLTEETFTRTTKPPKKAPIPTKTVAFPTIKNPTGISPTTTKLPFGMGGSVKSPGANTVGMKTPLGAGSSAMTWDGTVPTFKGNSWLENRWDHGIAGTANQFSHKDSPKTIFGKVGSTLLDQGLIKHVLPNLLGNRSFSERVTGKRPTGGAFEGEQVTNPNANGMNPEGFIDGSVTSGDPNQSMYELNFPMNLPSWKKEGVMGAAEDTTDTSAIGRRYAALQSNLKASEQAKASQEQEALNRRFASMGASNSGAALKNQNILGDAAARRLGEQQNGLYAAQSGEEQAATESMRQRNLARDQLRLGSEGENNQNLLDVAKIKIGNAQFNDQLALDRAISTQNADLAWKQANPDWLSQLSMGTLTTGMFGQQPAGSPYLPGIQGGGTPGVTQGPSAINWSSYQPQNRRY